MHHAANYVMIRQQLSSGVSSLSDQIAFNQLAQHCLFREGTLLLFKLNISDECSDQSITVSRGTV